MCRETYDPLGDDTESWKSGIDPHTLSAFDNHHYQRKPRPHDVTIEDHESLLIALRNKEKTLKK